MDTQRPLVLFGADDYAPVSRRIGAVLIDTAVVVLLLVVASAVAGLVRVPADVRTMPSSPEKQRQIAKHLKPVQAPIMAGWLVLSVSYHFFSRRLPGGTLGYRLFGLRLVEAGGGVPGWGPLWKRTLLAIPSALCVGLGYATCRGSPRRQAMHDQWAGTWVVRRAARPAGPAKAAFQTRLFGPWMMTYLDLEPLQEAGTPAEGG